LKLWTENFTTSVKTFKTINYSALPEDKWLLLGFTQQHDTKLCFISRSSEFVGSLSTEKTDFN